MGIVLRDYQQKDVGELRRHIYNGVKRLLLVEPTGAGKGTSCAFMIGEAIKREHSVLFLVNRRNLVNDMSRRLDKLGIDHGIIMGNHPRRKPWLRVHVASIDTLQRREDLPRATLIFLDEAHFSASPIWLKVLERYPDAVVIGMTATPIRLDGKGLGHIFQELVMGPTTADLQALGYLVPTRVFAPANPDLGAVKKTGGDYNQKQLSEAVDKPKLTGDIVEHWVKHARGRPTMAFAVDLKHSNHIVDQFNAAGIRAAHVDCNTKDDVRDATWESLKRGDLEVVSNVGIAGYGFDCPPISCLIQARPTASLALHLQQIGRSLRICPETGKYDALILDHAGNHFRHGFCEEVREWTLADQKRKSKAERAAIQARMCRGCYAAFSPGLSQCPYCGWVVPVSERRIDHEDGDLEEAQMENWYICEHCHHRGKLPPGRVVTDVNCPRCIIGSLKPIGSKYDPGLDAKRKQVFLDLTRKGRDNRYKKGYAAMQYRIRFGEWPPRGKVREWREEAFRWRVEDV